MAENRFKKAKIQNVRIKMALSGISKSGKTWVSLQTATNLIGTLKATKSLSGNGRIAVIDSENESALKYSDIYDFDHCPLHDFGPESYIELLNEAAEAGYSVVITDSISHEWMGVGGILETHTRLTAASSKKDSFATWGKVTPKHNAFLDAIVRYPCHLICTIRSRTKYVPIRASDGSLSEIRKLGARPVQRKETEYEFDILGSIADNHEIIFGGTRCVHLSDKKFPMDKTGDIGRILGEWVSQTYTGESVDTVDPETAAIVGDIMKYKGLMNLSDKSLTALLSRHSAATVQTLTPSNARAVLKQLKSDYERVQGKKDGISV